MRKFDVELLVLNESSSAKPPLNKREMIRVIRESLRAAKMKPDSYEVSVYLVDDPEMRELNRQHRKLNRTTDVLSFPQYAPGATIDHGEYGSIVLGDVVISLETLLRRSLKRGEDVKREYARLLIHGVLHLCGYDHSKISAC